MEQELEVLQRKMSDPTFFRGEAEATLTATTRVTALPQEIETAFERWAELDERR